MSSFDLARSRHPLYLIDGEHEDSAEAQFWSNSPDDVEPWIRIEFAQRADVSQVQLFLAHGDRVALPKNARIICEQREQAQAVSTSSHRLTIAEPNGNAQDTPCDATDAVTIEFELETAPHAAPLAISEVVIWERAR